ncbi:purine and uridine phosphorylase [Apiospora arundinis]|uniref:Purine and uridine phosphorylase n=1 Tax=Apiospora arundinis TaxID=335852 RepID=A0ABR2HS21_9PEZI
MATLHLYWTEESRPPTSVLPGKPVPDEDSDKFDEERLPAIQPDDIAVAIFCALTYESYAVKYTLGKEFAYASETNGHQNYVYSFGSIVKHNIVIARRVQMGPLNAAQDGH